jgi:hypothetical protein
MARKGAGALEIEWNEDGRFRPIEWCDDFSRVVDKAFGVSRVRKLDLEGFEAVYRVRFPDGTESHYLMPRKEPSAPVPSEQPPHGI